MTFSVVFCSATVLAQQLEGNCRANNDGSFNPAAAALTGQAWSRLAD